MERTQTGSGGLTVGQAVLLLDQFDAIFKKTRDTITAFPQKPAVTLTMAAAIAEAKWCYEQALFNTNAPGVGLAQDAITRLVEIPVPTAQQKQNAANLERQYEHA
jgi:hypothetical protein